MTTALLSMLDSQSTDLAEIAAWLDQASPAARAEAVFGLGRAGQRKLYQRASGAIGLEHFVPAGVEPLRPVRHRGANTLPLPGPLSRFEKRVCRPGDASARLFGYNESPFRTLIGPGYFVAYATSDHPAWTDRGGVVVDYFQVPDGSVPAAWPEVVPNTRGLQRFVFHGTRDFIRGVSQHVSIGSAYRNDKPLDQYFVLIRDES